MTIVNDQITDSITQVNTLVLGNAPAQSIGLLDITGAETLGMSMFNAVTAQQNSQTSSSAAATATCAKILQTVIEPPAPSPAPLNIKTIAEEAAAKILQSILSSGKPLTNLPATIKDELDKLVKNKSIPGLTNSIIDEVTKIISGPVPKP